MKDKDPEVFFVARTRSGQLLAGTELHFPHSRVVFHHSFTVISVVDPYHVDTDPDCENIRYGSESGSRPNFDNVRIQAKTIRV